MPLHEDAYGDVVPIKAVRTGDWQLHLLSPEPIIKYFFAHDKINYAGMIPVYLAEMTALKKRNPTIHQEFTNGNWVVNKNKDVSFCAVGGDNALEHLNRSMKVCGELVGITLYASAQTKFFVVAPESETEATSTAGLTTDAQEHHLSSAVRTNENKAIY